MAHRTKPRLRSNEQGFVLVWASFLFLGILVVGFTFLLYTLCHVTRFKSQFLAMNLVTIGSYSAEFDSDESLNSMALLARMEGFSGATPISTEQIFTNGALVFGHTVNSGIYSDLSAYVQLKQPNVIGGLISELGGISTASFSSSRPTPMYMHLVFDYSLSLAAGPIDNLLEGFEVTNSTGGAGPNGEVVGGKVVPKKEFQSVLPFGWDSNYRTVNPWSGASASWPTYANTSSGCAPDPAAISFENPCGSLYTGVATQQIWLRYNLSDMFLAYKKANAIITGSIGRITQLLDISVLCGALDPGLHALVNSMIAPNTFDLIDNNGICPMWKFDERDFSDVTINGDNQFTATVVGNHSFEDPKSIFEDSVLLTPDRLLQVYLSSTFYRKLLKYATIYGNNGTTVISAPGQYSKLLDPPLPKLKTPFPSDGFPFNMGPLIDKVEGGATTHEKVVNTSFVPFGWPGSPQPFLDSRGPAHPLNSDLPLDIRFPWEHDCTSGPPKSLNYPMSNDKTNPGFPLCLIYNQCNPSSPIDCSSAASIASHVNDYYDPSTARSPGCSDGSMPTCYSDGSRTIALTGTSAQAVTCLNNVPRCLGATQGGVPGCPGGGSLKCCEYVSGTSTCKTYDAIGLDTVVPTHSGWSGPPQKRGKVAFPTSIGPEIGSDVLHYLADLGPIIGGSNHQNAIPYERCSEAKNFYPGDEVPCVLVIVTDGVPDPSGMTADEALTSLEVRMDSFTNGLNGKVYTWYLGGNPTVYELTVDALNELQAGGSLTANTTSIYDTFVKVGDEIPDALCPIWDTERPSNISSCADYNDAVLPTHRKQYENFNRFKDIMSGTPSRVFIESSVYNSLSGTQLSNEFVAGLKELLTSTKREVTYQR